MQMDDRKKCREIFGACRCSCCEPLSRVHNPSSLVAQPSIRAQLEGLTETAHPVSRPFSGTSIISFHPHMSWQPLLDPNEHAVAGDVTPCPPLTNIPMRGTVCRSQHDSAVRAGSARHMRRDPPRCPLNKPSQEGARKLRARVRQPAW
jgi:hypothetical protein